MIEYPYVFLLFKCLNHLNHYFFFQYHDETIWNSIPSILPIIVTVVMKKNTISKSQMLYYKGIYLFILLLIYLYYFLQCF